MHAQLQALSINLKKEKHLINKDKEARDGLLRAPSSMFATGDGKIGEVKMFCKYSSYL